MVILRDDKPGLDFAGYWDFPGGGREDNESPEACAIRETSEELSIKISAKSIIWKKHYPSAKYPDAPSYFMVAPITNKQILVIAFTNEGQDWKLMSTTEILAHPNFVPDLKNRLKDYLDSKL